MMSQQLFNHPHICKKFAHAFLPPAGPHTLLPAHQCGPVCAAVEQMGNSTKDDSGGTDGDNSSGGDPPVRLFSEGDKVLAYHGPRIYEAKASFPFYLVQFTFHSSGYILLQCYITALQACRYILVGFLLRYLMSASSVASLRIGKIATTYSHILFSAIYSRFSFFAQ